jgi:hypothetical protein
MRLQLLAPVAPKASKHKQTAANSVPFLHAAHFSAERSVRPDARHILAQQPGLLWHVATRVLSATRNSDLSDDEKTTRPGVIRTHDQGIMSPGSQSS